MKKVLVVLLVLGFALSMLIAGGASEAKKDVIELKISTSQTEASLMYKVYDTYAKRVNERSGGRLNLSVYASSQLGNDEDVIEQALQGAAIAVNTDAARLGTYVKEIGVLMMGFIAEDYNEAYRMIKTPSFQGWMDELVEDHGIRSLSFSFYDGPRHFMTNKMINRPEDLKGLVIRTIGAPSCLESLSAMGATPIAMAWSDVYNGIQTKAIDGCEAQDTSLYPSKIYEVTKYQTKTGHFQLMQTLIVGERWFKTVPADLQKLLLDVADEVGQESAKWVMEESDRVEELMKQAGLVVTEPNLKPFVDSVESAYAKLGYLDVRNTLYKEIGKTL